MVETDIYYGNVRNDMLDYLPPKISRSIEFGCSQGLFSQRVKELHKAEVWGVDIDEASVKKAAVILDKALAGDAMQIIDQLPDDYFDCLICNDFLEHLPRPDLFIKKITRVMTSGAVIVASVPNVRSWSNILELLVRKEWRYKDSGILDRTHLRFFTLKSFERFLTECRLEVEIVQGTRPSSSKVFLLTNLLTLGFISDMSFSGIAARAKFKR